jgi:hypothetical protein
MFWPSLAIFKRPSNIIKENYFMQFFVALECLRSLSKIDLLSSGKIVKIVPNIVNE